jgi:branched-chain amino acid transport system permease protein
VPRLLPGADLHDPVVFYYAALPLVLLGYWFAHRVVHSPFGHVLVAIRDNEARAQALGFPVRRYKLIAFMISASLAGVGGSLQSLSHGFATLELVHWTTSGQVVIMTILGGIGTLWGSLAGAAIFLLLRDWLSSSAQTTTLPVVGDWLKALSDGPLVITGAIFIVIVLNFRHGVWGTLLRLRQEPRAFGRLIRRTLRLEPTK